jgi:hypothetical protein
VEEAVEVPIELDEDDERKSAATAGLFERNAAARELLGQPLEEQGLLSQQPRNGGLVSAQVCHNPAEHS